MLWRSGRSSQSLRSLRPAGSGAGLGLICLLGTLAIMPAHVWGVHFGVLPVAAEPCDPRPVLNAVEQVFLAAGTEKHALLARVDTGASLSSLDLELAQSLGLDRPVLREILVRNAHGLSRRPVVKLRYVLRGQAFESEFTLVSRSEMPHPMLLGRSSLAGFLVDPAGD